MITRLVEDLEVKKHIIDSCFARPVTLLIESRSAVTGVTTPTTQLRSTHNYRVHLKGVTSTMGSMGEKMIVGFVPLSDLHAIYLGMGPRFFERNIRSALPGNGAISASLRRALTDIVIDGKSDPATFAFNHNGVTLSAEAASLDGEHFSLVEPRLLNGAQTVISVARFIADLGSRNQTEAAKHALSRVSVLSRFITDASATFITAVTVGNNRQNPVHPWNLRANDMIQLEIQDKFRNEGGIYYERQQNTFDLLSTDNLAEQGITQYRPVDMLRLARTFLAADGDIDLVGHINAVFEDDHAYNKVFNQDRLAVDLRKVIVCYKIQFVLGRLVHELLQRGPEKHAFVLRARTLLWSLMSQAVLNDSQLDMLTRDFGVVLGLESKFKEWLLEAARNKCRVLLLDLAADKRYAAKIAKADYGFVRTSFAYKQAMENACTRWKWSEKKLL